MRRFFIADDQLGHTEPCLSPSDARHIRTVLRLTVGDRIVVMDSTGAAHEACITAIDRHEVRISLAERLDDAAESPLQIALAQGYLKDKKMDQLVRGLTELGVADWVPVMAGRSVPSPDGKRIAARHQRWQKISQEATKQCRRNRPMTIHAPIAFEAALDFAEPYDLKLFFWESGGEDLAGFARSMDAVRSVFVMIGPEGGFEVAEQQAAAQRGFRTLQMGPRILRAETAAVAACTLVQYLFGDLGQNVLDNPKPVL